MKKGIALLLALVLALGLTVPALAEAGTYEIALITDVGNIDDHSFNQSAWEGVKEYAEANNITYAYYKPNEDSDLSREEQMQAAVDKGAKVIVLPGYMFGESAVNFGKAHPETQILLVDTPPSEVMENIYSIDYQEEQSGFFAGYAAVKDGYRKIGYLGGMAVPAVVRYGYGFVQGVDFAAAELGLSDVELKYWYSDLFWADDGIKTKMGGWFTEGTEVVFACGGKIYLSAISAAQEAGNAKIIGVDCDQALDGDMIITSAMKDLNNSIQVALGALYANGGTWGDLGGTHATLGAKDGGVALPTAPESWRMPNFSVEEYHALFEKVVGGEITISNDIDNAPAVTAITVDYQN